MVHGLAQSEAHAKAAREYSAAKFAQAQGLPGADELVKQVHTKLRKALQEFIDPHKIYRQW